MAGLKVYNDDNENIGSINDLLMDKSGNIKIAVIGVGGFLGMGEHLVAVPYEKLKFVNEAVAYTGTAARRRHAATARFDHHDTGAATGTDNQRAKHGTAPSSTSNPGIRTTPCSMRPRTS